MLNHKLLRICTKAEFGTLVLIASCTSLLLFFALLADWALGEPTPGVDKTVMLLMRDANDIHNPWGPGWFEELVRDYTALGGIPVLVALSFFVACYLAMEQKYRATVYIITTTVSALVISSLLKDIFDRPRPDLVEAGTRVYTSSFPSTHAMMSACIYLTFGALLARFETRRIKKVAVLMFFTLVILVVGISRIYLGVHWPTDILAGWTAGTLWALFCWLIYRYLDTPPPHENQQPDFTKEQA